MPALICPFCRAPLTREEKTWRCSAGYVNLRRLRCCCLHAKPDSAEAAGLTGGVKSVT